MGLDLLLVLDNVAIVLLQAHEAAFPHPSVLYEVIRLCHPFSTLGGLMLRALTSRKHCLNEVLGVTEHYTKAIGASVGPG